MLAAAAATTTTCPTSFQLRWGLQGRKSFVLVRARLGVGRPARRWSGVVGASNGGEGERRTEGDVGDSFSGWLKEDPDGGDGKKGYGGLIGVGLAGIFLATGVMFASMSFSSKRPAGIKRQMEPLTLQQDELLSTDEQTEKVGTDKEKNDMLLTTEDIQRNTSGVEQQKDPLTSQHEELSLSVEQSENDGIDEEKNDALLTNGNIQGNTPGTYEDHISSLQPAESASESKHDDNTLQLSSSTHETEFPADFSDIIPNSDLLDDSDSFVSNTPGLNQNSSKSRILGSADGYGHKDLSSNMVSSKEDIVVNLLDNLSAKTSDLPLNGSDLTPNSDLQEGRPLSPETENFISSSEVTAQFKDEVLDFNSSSDIETNVNIGNLADPNDALKAENQFSHVPEKETVEKLHPLNEALELSNNKIKNIPSETILSNQKSLDQSVLSVAPSHSKNQIVENPSNEHLEKHKNQSSNSISHNSFFSRAGIPAPSVVSSGLNVPLGNILVPAVVDQVQAQALSALQVLKVIEEDVQPIDICTRREYARWLVSASSVLSRSTSSKVYPAMYIENVTELAFDDITPQDPDFPSIQGLAEAGLISSKLSRSDMDNAESQELGTMLFSPERPLSRQDLVSWKMVLERRKLPEVDKEEFRQCSGYIDIDKIHPDAWPAIVADLSSGESGIISYAFGYTRLFQPEKPVTKAQAAVALSIGEAAEVVGEELTRIEVESLAETAVAAHTALVAEVEKDLNASFEKELSTEREKIDAIEKLAEEAKAELEKLRQEREEENKSLIMGRAAVEAEMEVLSRLRNDVEEQLQNLISNKTEISFEKDRVNKLRMEAENENQVIIQLQYELEIEKKALAMARAWAEDEAKRAREQAKALEEARERWERHGIRVIVDEELRESASDGVTFLTSEKQVSVEEATVTPESVIERFKSRSHIFYEELKARAESLVEKLKILSSKVRGKSAAVIQQIIQKIEAIIAASKHQSAVATQKVQETYTVLASSAGRSMHEVKDTVSSLGSGVKLNATRIAEDWKESMGKLTQKFKT